MENRLFFAYHVCLCNIYPLCAFVITLYFPSEEERKHEGGTMRDYGRLSTQNNHKAHNLTLSHIHKNTTTSKKYIWWCPKVRALNKNVGFKI